MDYHLERVAEMTGIKWLLLLNIDSVICCCSEKEHEIQPGLKPGSSEFWSDASTK